MSSRPHFTSSPSTPFRAASLFAVMLILTMAGIALGGPLAAFKLESPCDYTISAAHGPAGPAADAHAVGGLPAANWTHAPFNCNYVPGPPNGVSVGHRTRHMVPNCHPGLDAPMGALWSPSWGVAAPPPGGGVVSVAGGATRGHAPHADVYAGTLSVSYNAAGAVTGYTFSSAGKHDPADCRAACAAGSALQTVPPAVSNAFASISFVIDGATLDYSISIAARGVTQANLIGAAIHAGAPGQIGPMIIDLGPGAQWQDMQGMGISRMITGAPFPAQYLAALQQGQTYVNLRTMAFPQGEVRGQLTEPPMQRMADMNCDGVVNGKDVEAFVLAVLSPADYSTRYHGCDTNNGDINGDGRIDDADVPDFAAALAN